MKTIERNYRTNPHTASFLRKFHTGGTGLPATIEDDNKAEYALAAADLLDSIPMEVPARDCRTTAQTSFMENLITRITELDEATGAQARTYTDGMTENLRWTAGRDGNASSWIDRMIRKERELKSKAGVVALPQIADGRYAVEHEGTLKFFKVRAARSGSIFLDVQASDELHPVRNLGTKRAVLSLIAADPQAAMVRYGRELGVCGRCGRTLTDEASRAAGIGPVCIDK